MNIQQFVDQVSEKHGGSILRAKTIKLEAEMYGAKIPVKFWTLGKVSRGIFNLDILRNINKTFDNNVEVVEIVQETDEEILERQRDSFSAMDRMVEAVIDGEVTSMIVSGNPGIGKTYNIELSLENAFLEEKIQYTPVKGFVKPTGIFRLLWQNRHEGNVLLIDDADSVFDDEVGLNIWKAALDSTKRRMISWKTEKKWEDAEGDEIPSTFEFRGSVIFVTNRDFDSMIQSGNKMAPHYSALISRSFYLDLNLRNTREFLIRIKDVVQNTDMLHTLGLDENQKEVLMDFIEDNHKKLRELSLRMVLKLAKILRFSKSDEDFVRLAKSSCFKAR